tara:strand:- start:450 stop:773 length:324 start_codon:yes stop_codon:yes gene_type:complete
MARKKHTGRKKGATSCIRVSLKELQNLLNENSTVMVNKRWAEQVGVTVKYEPVTMSGERVYATTENVNADSILVESKLTDNLAEEPDVAAKFKVTQLEEEAPVSTDW